MGLCRGGDAPVRQGGDGQAWELQGEGGCGSRARLGPRELETAAPQWASARRSSRGGAAVVYAGEVFRQGLFIGREWKDKQEGREGSSGRSLIGKGRRRRLCFHGRPSNVA